MREGSMSMPENFPVSVDQFGGLSARVSALERLMGSFAPLASA
jgi:hypothetical protein